MNFQNTWIGGNQPPAPGGLMSGYAPWGLSQMATNGGETAPTVGSPINPARAGGGGDPRGYSVPGDPSNAATTSQATRDRVASSLKGSIVGNLATTGLKTAAALGLGMPGSMVGQAAIGSLAGPASIGNVLGGAVNAAIGTQPQGFFGKALANIPSIAGAVIGGPVGGLLGGMIGGPLADGVMDGLDARKNEALRDDMENKSGYVGGRVGYADMQSYAERANAIEAAVKGVVDKVNVGRAIAGIDPVGYSPRGISIGGMEVGTPGSRSYGGWGNVGGPEGGARSVDRGYGENMGGFAGLGIGNPSSYGGKSSGSSGGSGGGSGGKSSGGGGYGGHAGGKDGSSTGFGR